MFYYKQIDVGNPSKKMEIYEKWTDRILKEFFQQGDMEKSHSLAISPFFDRNNTFVPSSQLGFIDFICIPIYDALDNFVDIKCITNSNY